MGDNDNSQILKNLVEELQIEEDTWLKANENQTPTCTPRKTKKNILKKSKIDLLENAVKPLKEICKKVIIENKFTLYGKYVSTQLEQLPLDEALVLQSNITNMVHCARKHPIQTVNTATSTTELQFTPSPSNSNNSNYSYSTNESTNDYEVIYVTIWPI